VGKLNKVILIFAILLLLGCERPLQVLFVDKNAKSYYAYRSISYKEFGALKEKKRKVLYVEIKIEKHQYIKTFKNMNTIYLREGKNLENIGSMENGKSNKEWDGGYFKKKNDIYTLRYEIDDNVSIDRLVDNNNIKNKCIFVQSEPYIGFPRELFVSNCFFVN
jgi:hypothetical protein